MARGKSSISKARTDEEMGEFWDTHNSADYWELTKPVKFTVDIESEMFYYRLESSLARQLQTLAQRRGVSTETLFNL